MGVLGIVCYSPPPERHCLEQAGQGCKGVSGGQGGVASRGGQATSFHTLPPAPYQGPFPVSCRRTRPLLGLIPPARGAGVKGHGVALRGGATAPAPRARRCEACSLRLGRGCDTGPPTSSPRRAAHPEAGLPPPGRPPGRAAAGSGVSVPCWAAAEPPQAEDSRARSPSAELGLGASLFRYKYPCESEDRRFQQGRRPVPAAPRPVRVQAPPPPRARPRPTFQAKRGFNGK